MPTISMFHGLIIRMYYFDTQQHRQPHFHVYFQENSAVYAINTGTLLEGKLPRNKQKLIEAWQELHKEELLADWKLVESGEQPFKIEPLR